MSDLTDQWLAALFADSGGLEAGGALVATGGYGRRELAPGSDLDLLLLLPAGVEGSVAAAIADRLWYPVWDSGLRLDHTVRSPSEVRRVAAEDIRSLLGLLDARHLSGSPELSAQVRSSVLADWRALAPKRLPELVATARERAARSGDVAYALEPDLKESRGGLRDLTVLRAIAASWVTDGPREGLDGARDTLLDVRDALHAVTGRASDRLVQQEQDEVAALLGWSDRDHLLRRVGMAGRSIAYALDLTFHQVERDAQTSRLRSRLVRGRRRLVAAPPRTPLADGVVEQDGQAVLARDARPDRDASLVLRAAAAAAQYGIRLAPPTIERLAAEAPALTEPWSADARDGLISLLGAGTAALPVWEALDQAGLVTRMLPDWERVRSRPQRNPVHRFTVDRHLVETASVASRFTRRVDRPDLLLVGALLHDIGKGWPGDHTVAGERVVADVAPRLGFDDADSAILVQLVRHHLLLPNTATQRDLDDPATASMVAEQVGSSAQLDLLHALAEADGLATGPGAWGDWKARLVADLVARTHRLLRGQPAPPVARLSAEEVALANRPGLSVLAAHDSNGLRITVVAPDRGGLLATVAGVLAVHRLEVRRATADLVGASAVQVWTVHPEFGGSDDIAAVREDIIRSLAGQWDARAILARRERHRDQPTASAGPVAAILECASERATVLEVRAHDRPGLVHEIAHVIAECGASVRSAVVSTLGSEVVDVFYLVGPHGRPLDETTTAELLQAVRTVLRSDAW